MADEPTPSGRIERPIYGRQHVAYWTAIEDGAGPPRREHWFIRWYLRWHPFSPLVVWVVVAAFTYALLSYV